MGKSKPKAPKAPDPAATAQAQSAANREAVRESALVSQIGQDTPFGSVRFLGPIGSPDRRQVVSLTPSGQRQLTQQNLLAELLGGRAVQMAGGLPDKAFNLRGLPGRPGGIDFRSLPGGQFLRPSGPELTTGFDTSGLPEFHWDRRTNNLPRVGSLGTVGPDLSTGLNRGGLPEIPGVGGFGAERQRVEDAVYGRNLSRLQPRFEQEEARLEQSLANRGIPPGSEQWNDEVAAYQMAKTDALSAARNEAIAAGGSEQSRLAGLAMSARGQLVGEQLQEADLLAATRGQLFGEEVERFGSRERMRDRTAQERLTDINLINQARQLGLQEQLSGAQLASGARQQLLGEQLQARQQGIQEQQLRRSLQQSDRDRAIQEMLMVRQQPMNELAALLQGSPALGMPQAQSPGGFNVAPADIMGATQLGYQGALNRYNADLANQQAFFGGLGQLGGSVLGAAGAAGGFGALFSDRRLKTNIRRIATSDRGLGVYSFNYVWGGPTSIGYMADEVEQIAPEAVSEVAGFKVVDYSRV